MPTLQNIVGLNQTHSIKFLLYYLPYYLLGKKTVSNRPFKKGRLSFTDVYDGFTTVLEARDNYGHILPEYYSQIYQWAEISLSDSALRLFFNKTTLALSTPARLQYQEFRDRYQPIIYKHSDNSFNDYTASWSFTDFKNWKHDLFMEYVNVLKPSFSDLYLGFGLEQMRQKLVLAPSEENKTLFHYIINQVIKHSLRKSKFDLGGQRLLIADFIQFYWIRKKYGSGKPFAIWRTKLHLPQQRNQVREVAVRATWKLISSLENQLKSPFFSGLQYIRCMAKYLKYLADVEWVDYGGEMVAELKIPKVSSEVKKNSASLLPIHSNN